MTFSSSPFARWALIALATVGLGLASGCGGGFAFGHRFHYANVAMNVEATGAITVAVASVDHREIIVSGKKKSHFVGVTRAGFGNAYSVVTASGAPFADAVTTAICGGLRQRGYTCQPITVAPGTAEADARAAAAAGGGQLALVFLFRQWKSDTYTNTALHYDVQLQVVTAAGEVVATTQVQGQDDLGGSFWNPAGHAGNAVPPAFRAKMEQLLNEPGVKAILEAVSGQS